ncbi:MAG TPA: DUF6186 family protein [Acidimicrobiales bacterium]|nr:DUF6186 family protein [Acidimicrobiales bacterium]
MSSTPSYAVWALLGALALALWVVSLTPAGRRLIVRPAAVLRRLATDPWLRVPLLLGWGWLGWHLFAR